MRPRAVPVGPRDERLRAPATLAHGLDLLRFERTYVDESSAALSALDCLLLGRKGVYASSELTSGRRAQALQRQYGLADASALRETLSPEQYDSLLWTPNVSAAVAFALDVRERLGDGEFVISPAPFTAPGWSQQAYLAFWETVIRTRANAAYFNEGWEYSNGCVYEFLVATVAGLPTFARDGQSVSAELGITRISRAVRDLDGEAMDTRFIRSSLDSLTRHVTSGG